MSLSLLLLGTLLGAGPSAPPAPYPDGQALLRAMQERYAGKWYRTLTFVQTTTLPAKQRVETWYEAASIPGKLRIDIAPLDSGSAIVFRQDSVYRVRGGKAGKGQAFVHPLMVLGFDVYRDSVSRTIARLTALGFDLGKIREDQWQGRPVYVVGAAAGDTTSKQFWVDRERLVFVRMLEPSGSGPGSVAETQFNRYQPLGQGWISVEVLFTVGGELIQKEEYADARADVALPESLWDPAQFTPPAWVGH